MTGSSYAISWIVLGIAAFLAFAGCMDDNWSFARILGAACALLWFAAQIAAIFVGFK